MAASNVVKLSEFVIFPSWVLGIYIAQSCRTSTLSAPILLGLFTHGSHKNVVGPRVRKLRWEKNLRQQDLAAQLELAGWQLDRAGVSKVESRFIKVSDCQLLCLMSVLKVDAKALLPAIDPKKPIGDQIRKLMRCP